MQLLDQRLGFRRRCFDRIFGTNSTTPQHARHGGSGQSSLHEVSTSP